jgi:hypothetical protein
MVHDSPPGAAQRQALSSAPEAESLTVDETHIRALGVTTSLLDETQLWRGRFQLLAEVERQLRPLLKIRSGGKARFRSLTRETRKARRVLEDEERYWSAIDRIAEGDPEVEAILEQFCPEWERR